MPNLELPLAPWIVGHRGAAGEVRENTLASVRRGLEAGADMVELDVQLTRDGELVCFHDETLERIAGRPDTVEGSDASTLVGIDLAAGTSRGGDPESARIPLLGEALREVAEDRPLNIELKRRHAPGAKLARRLLEELDGRAQVLVSSFDWELLGELRALAPDLPLAPIEKRRPRELIEAGRAIGAFSLHCHRRLATRGFIRQAAAAGFDRILVFTVNDPELAERLFDAGVSGVFTDVPSKLVEHFGSRS